MKAKQDPSSRALWSYSAIVGSVGVLLGGLVSLPFPDFWGIVVWMVVSITLCTAGGLAADRFIE